MGSAYRVIVDENNAPWISGDDAYRFDRDTEEFEEVGLGAGGFGFVGGIASDGEGSIWVGTYTDGQYVHRIANDDTLEHHTVDTPGVSTFGTAVDFDRHAWTFGYNDGTAAAIDLDTETVEHVFDTCNGPCLNMPYVRGDITGLQRRNALNPTGTFTRLVEGCDSGADTEWGRIVIDADTPAGSNLVVSVKTADDLGALAAMEWLTVGIVPDDGTELDLAAALERAGVEPGHYLSVQVRLQSLDRVTSPTLRRVDVQWGCEGMIE
ncbi:MAG: hypothetical protein HYY06_20675 [Deltaproteobacteria bacterium]|nr:hypothetical protein [Deltaproteobacteria bacterium]